MSNGKPSLLIVSDSPMWMHNGQLHILESTLREVEMLTEVFGHITWLGFLYPGLPGANARPDTTGKISACTLPLLGGSGLMAKVKQLLMLPVWWWRIAKLIRRHSFIHSRAPSVPAAAAIVFSLVDSKRKYWHKFAGSWNRPDAPRSYQWQKQLLLKANRTRVTINGTWPGLPSHVLPFENPCLSKSELATATVAANAKTFNGPLRLLYAGRIEYEKGVDRIIHAINLLPPSLQTRIEQLTLVGAGKQPALNQLTELAQTLKVPHQFTGPLGRNDLNHCYAGHHLFFFPSNTEGFPKVVAEAAAYGCVPVVSDVSSIGQYIADGQTGFLLPDMEPQAIANKLASVLSNLDALQNIALQANHMAALFTYEQYNHRIASEVFELNESPLLSVSAKA